MDAILFIGGLFLVICFVVVAIGLMSAPERRSDDNDNFYKAMERKEP
jgi:hypothetical protein